MLKRQTEPKVSAVAMLGAMNAKVRGFRERDGELLVQERALRDAGIKPVDAEVEPEHVAVARRLLNGLQSAPPAEGRPGVRLRAIMVEREGIRIAVETLEQEYVRHQVLALSEVMQTRGVAWMRLVRARALAVVALRKANHDCETFRDEVRKIAGMAPSLRCDRRGGPLFGNVVGDPAYEFIADALAAGAITEAEAK